MHYAAVGNPRTTTTFNHKILKFGDLKKVQKIQKVSNRPEIFINNFNINLNVNIHSPTSESL